MPLDSILQAARSLPKWTYAVAFAAAVILWQRNKQKGKRRTTRTSEAGEQGLKKRRSVHSVPDLNLFKQATLNPTKIAIHSDGQSFRYGDLLQDSKAVQQLLLEALGDDIKDLDGARVCFLCPPSYSYVATQWGVWRAGGVCVPLCNGHPRPEMQYVVEDSQASIVLCTPNYIDRVKPIADDLGLKFVVLGDFHPRPSSECEMKMEPYRFDADRNALIIYSSGTTGRPKGVLSTHRIIENQTTSLTEAWQWTSDDHILHSLPLHHIHGIVNKLCCALYSGAQVTFLRKFNAQKLFDTLSEDQSISLYMAVPTIYVRLIRAYEQMTPEQQKRASAAVNGLRFMVSGSASLPAPVSKRWTEISGQVLLERYGMTECGMIISNPLNGLRKPGYVGKPLPGVTVKLGENDAVLVKSKGMFKEYWNLPDITRKSFTEDGWFITGDQALQDEEDETYKMLGRSSVDVLKSSGYKISALEVERVLHEHEDIREAAVVGVPSEEYGQIIAACIVMVDDVSPITLQELKPWAKERIADYKVPRMMKVVDEMPCKNAMGKVQKKDLLKIVFLDDQN